MIGNDIVDLDAASIQPNRRRKRFLDKVFTDEEQSLIFHSKGGFKMAWLLWSMKESAYKIYVQQHSKRFFAPKIIQCKLFNKEEGIVNIKGEKYATKSEIKDGYIHTIAFRCMSINNRLFSSKGFQPLVHSTQGVETPWKVSIIFTDVLNDSSKKVLCSSFKIQGNSYAAQHEESYRQIKFAFSKRFNLPIREIQIKKNAIGIPELFQQSRQLPIPFSISHHGNYGAFSILN